MKLYSMKVSNNGVYIHYLSSNPQSSLTPLVICPGLSETAEDYLDLMEYLSPRPCIAISFRGRGQSDTPEAGYTLNDHVSDIASVIDAAQLSSFHLYAYSRGVSYALGYLKDNMSKVVSAIMQEYPAEHRRITPNWVDSYLNEYLIPFYRQQHIRPEAVRGIQLESEQVTFQFPIPRKMLVIRGLLEGSLVDDEAIKGYQRLSTEIEYADFHQSGHDIRNTERELLYRTIHDFIRNA
ncbi:alpha/beta hydrolase [Cohnella lubricantis]